jgi:hypothetical protein
MPFMQLPQWFVANSLRTTGREAEWIAGKEGMTAPTRNPQNAPAFLN